MSSITTKKILVAVDDSRRSIDTVRYLAQTPSFCQMEIHLMHVFVAVPETYWDLQKEPSAIRNVTQLHAWEARHRTIIEKHIQTCREILLAHDGHPKNIQVHIRKRKRGVARDIIAEAAKGYIAVVLRRRGMTRLQKLVMGSTALKLLNGITALPLIFAGSKPDNPRVLLAFDGSKNAFRAVDFACATLTPGYHSVLLVSVLRTYLEDELRENGDKAFKDLLELPLEPMTEKMNQAVARFHACGFSHEGIQSRIVSNGSSRAGTIVDLAASEDFGTIIAGRKGHSMVRDFALGRVSQKILQLSPGYAVWLIN